MSAWFDRSGAVCGGAQITERSTCAEEFAVSLVWKDLGWSYLVEVKFKDPGWSYLVEVEEISLVALENILDVGGVWCNCF